MGWVKRDVITSAEKLRLTGSIAVFSFCKRLSGDKWQDITVKSEGE